MCILVFNIVKIAAMYQNDMLINLQEKQFLHLLIPSCFSILATPLESDSFQEFIHLNACDVTKWAEFIALKEYKNQPRIIEFIFPKLKEVFEAFPSNKIYEETISKFPHYITATLVGRHMNTMGNEMVLARYFASKDNCIGLHYRIAWDTKESSKKALRYLQSFAKNNFEVLKMQ